jgi:hypothetical protein
MLVADAGGLTAPAAGEAGLDPPAGVDGVQLVSFRAARHVVFFTGEIDAADLMALADAAAPQLRRGLSGT